MQSPNCAAAGVCSATVGQSIYGAVLEAGARAGLGPGRSDPAAVARRASRSRGDRPAPAEELFGSAPTGAEKLHPHRQAPCTEPGRNPSAGHTRQRHRHHHLHPAVIGIKRVPVDRLAGGAIWRKGPDLRATAAPARHRFQTAPPDAHTSATGSGSRRRPPRRQRQARSISQTVRASAAPVWRGRHKARRVAGVQHGAQGGPALPQVVSRRKGGGQRLHRAAESSNTASAASHRSQYARLATHRRRPSRPASRCAAPCTGASSPAAKSPPSRPNGAAGVWPGDHLEKPRQVLRATRHRPVGGQCRKERVAIRVVRHQPEARPKPVDVAERRRVAQRSHRVGAVRHRHEPSPPAPPPRRPTTRPRCGSDHRGSAWCRAPG